MKQITREHLEKTMAVYEQNEQRARAMAAAEQDAIIKDSITYQANKARGMALALRQIIGELNSLDPEADMHSTSRQNGSITIRDLHEIKDAYEKDEKALFATTATEQAAEARGSKEAIEELIFVMTGSWPELR